MGEPPCAPSSCTQASLLPWDGSPEDPQMSFTFLLLPTPHQLQVPTALWSILVSPLGGNVSLRPQQCPGEQLLSHSLADHTEPTSGSQCGLKGTQQGIREMCAGTRRIRNEGDASVEGGVGRECNSRAPSSLVTAELPSLHPHGTGTIRSFFWLFPPFVCTQHRAQ